MVNQMVEVALVQYDKGYILRRRDVGGKARGISLTETDLLSLRPLIQRECARILEKLVTPAMKARGVSPSVDLTVRRFAVANDPHQTEVYLSLEDADGNDFRFSLSVEAAHRIGKRLVDRADRLTGLGTSGTKQ